jgi:hypothetical protein
VLIISENKVLKIFEFKNTFSGWFFYSAKLLYYGGRCKNEKVFVFVTYGDYACLPIDNAGICKYRGYDGQYGGGEPDDPGKTSGFLR